MHSLIIARCKALYGLVWHATCDAACAPDDGRSARSGDDGKGLTVVMIEQSSRTFSSTTKQIRTSGCLTVRIDVSLQLPCSTLISAFKSTAKD